MEEFVVKNPDNYLNEVLEFYMAQMQAQIQAEMEAEMEAYYAAEHRQFGYIALTANNQVNPIK
jgi:hypothetical protein